METDLALIRKVGRAAASVSVTGVAVPFVLGLLLGLFGLPDRMLPEPGDGRRIQSRRALADEILHDVETLAG